GQPGRRAARGRKVSIGTVVKASDRIQKRENNEDGQQPKSAPNVTVPIIATAPIPCNQSHVTVQPAEDRVTAATGQPLHLEFAVVEIIRRPIITSFVVVLFQSLVELGDKIVIPLVRISRLVVA